MGRSLRTAAGAAAIVAGFAAWLMLKPGGERVIVDLVEELPRAKDRRPTPETFEVVDATLSGITQKAVFMRGQSRIVYTVAVPRGAWLKLSLGLQPEAWTVEGDGVFFQVGAIDLDGYTELFSLTVNPFGHPGDRNWHDVALDLSRYEGQTIDLSFNTLHSPPPPPGGPRGDDRNGDLPLWGSPRIVVR